MTCAGFLISCLVATGLCITLEFPFTALLKELTTPLVKKANGEHVEEVKVAEPNKSIETIQQQPAGDQSNGHSKIKREASEENHQTRF